MQPDLPVRKPPGPLPGTGNGVIQLTIAPSSQGVRGAEWVVGENCKKPGREVKAGSGPSSPLTSVRLWAIIASTGRTFGPGVDPTVSTAKNGARIVVDKRSLWQRKALKGSRLRLLIWGVLAAFLVVEKHGLTPTVQWPDPHSSGGRNRARSCRTSSGALQRRDLQATSRAL